MPAARLGGTPSPVVFQAVWPQQRVAWPRSAYRISADKPEQIPLFVYNFGSQPVEGRLWVVAPKGWKLSLPDRVRVQCGERVESALAVDCERQRRPASRSVSTAISGRRAPPSSRCGCFPKDVEILGGREEGGRGKAKSLTFPLFSSFPFSLSYLNPNFAGHESCWQ